MMTFLAAVGAITLCIGIISLAEIFYIGIRVKMLGGNWNSKYVKSKK